MRSGHFISTTVWLWDFPCVVGMLWTWWASELWMEVPSLTGLDCPGIMHKPGVRTAQLSDRGQCWLRDSRWIPLSALPILAVWPCMSLSSPDPQLPTV